MFNSLREELNKIALMEDEELDMMDTYDVGGDDGAADDELVDDENFFMEEDEDDDDDEVDALLEAILLGESDDDYEDDDESSLDYQDGEIGDGRTIVGDPDDEDYDEVDINGITNSIHDDIDEDDEEDLDDLLEAMCGCGDCVGDGRYVHADNHEIYGDSADMPDGDIPPTPQYGRMSAMRASGREFIDYGNANYQKFGKVFLDRSLMNNMTVDNDEFDTDGDEYNLYASAGNIYDDDENEEYYGIRDKVRTSELYGRHSINNINAAALGDRYDSNQDALDESVALFLQNYLG